MYQGRLGLVKNSALAFAFLLTALEVHHFLAADKLQLTGFLFSSTTTLALFGVWLYTQQIENLKAASFTLIGILCVMFTGLLFFSGELQGPALLIGSVLPLLTLVLVDTRSCLVTAGYVTLSCISLILWTTIAGPLTAAVPSTAVVYLIYSITLMWLTCWTAWLTCRSCLLDRE